jgi:hypothetical protein
VVPEESGREFKYADGDVPTVKRGDAAIGAANVILVASQ